MPKWMRTLLGILAVLFVIFLVTKIPKPRRQAMTAKLSEPVKVEITRPGESIALERSADGWKLTKPLDFPADGQAVKEFLAALGDLSIGERLTERPESHGLYDVTDASGTLVQVWEKDKKEPNAWIFGKSSPGFTHVYLRLPGSNEVFLSQGLRREELERSPAEWRDRLVFRLEDSDDIVRAEIQKGAASYVVEKSSDQWTVNGRPGDPNKVQALMSALKAFAAEGFVDPPAVDLKKLGLHAPAGKISLKTAKSAAYKVIIGKKDEQRRIPIQRDNEPNIYLLSDYHWEQVPATAQELISQQ